MPEQLLEQLPQGFEPVPVPGYEPGNPDVFVGGPGLGPSRITVRPMPPQLPEPRPPEIGGPGGPQPTAPAAPAMPQVQAQPAAPQPQATPQPAPPAPQLPTGTQGPQYEPTDTSLSQAPDIPLQSVLPQGFEPVQVEQPVQVEPNVPILLQMGATFNHSLAYALGVPIGAAKELTQFLATGKFGSGEDVPVAIEAFLNKIGIPARKFDTVAGNMSQEFLYGMATLATLGEFAPAMAAKTGMDTVSMLIRDLGNAIQRYPILATLQEFGADAGTVIGRHITGSDKKHADTWYGALGQGAGEVAGAMAGGLTAGGMYAMGERAGRAAIGVGRRIPGVNQAVEYFFPKTEHPKAPIYPGLDPSVSQGFAQQAIDAADLRMQNVVEHALERIKSAQTPAEAQARFRVLIDRAERIGNRIVSQFWKRTPMNQRVPMTQIRGEVTAMEAELADEPYKTPTALMKGLKELSMPYRNPDTGKMTASLPTVRRLRDYRGHIRLARKAEEASDAPNDALIRNMVRLEQIIDDGIQAAFPNDTTIAQARAVSIKYHDIFSRSSLGQMFAQRQTGAARVHPEQTAERLLKTYGGMRDLVAGRNRLLYQRAPGGKSFAVTRAERQELQALTGEAENSIRAMFQDIARDGAPVAVRWIDKNLPLVKPLGRVFGELYWVHDHLANVIAERKTIMNGALAKYAASDPRASVSKLWSNPHGLSDLHEVMLTMRNDEDALDGLRTQFINEFFTRSKLDPIRMKQILDDPKLSKMFQLVLGDERYARFAKLTRVAREVALGHEGVVKRHAIRRLTFAGRLIGAMIGRHVARWTGGGSVQIPALFSGAMGRSAERMFRLTKPGDLFVMGVIHPKWEQILLMRDPSNFAQARNYIKLMRRSLTAIEAGTSLGRQQFEDAKHYE